MLFSIRGTRKVAAWEVVDSEMVEPVPMYYDDEGKNSVPVTYLTPCPILTLCST